MAVQAVQAAVEAAGHELTLDWTRGQDASLVEYEQNPDSSAAVAQADLDAVLAADAVLIVTSEHDGRGMFVELGCCARSCPDRRPRARDRRRSDPARERLLLPPERPPSGPRGRMAQRVAQAAMTTES